MNTIQTLKGFRDFIGPDVYKRNWLIGVFRSVFERYGFEPLETPALEYESLLLGKYGAEADKLLYAFEDRGGRRVALRYDQTVPTARVIAQYRHQLTMPFKRYQIQPVWRADKPQKGRFREFYQCDIDILGAPSVAADATILAVVASVFDELGVTAHIKINDRAHLIELIHHCGVTEEHTVMSVIQSLDKLDSKAGDVVIAELRAKGLTAEMCDQLFAAIHADQIPENLARIVSLAQNMGVPTDMIKYTPSLARGLDYYTGMIFEIVIPEYSAGSVGGGGRYDKLLQTLVDVDMPAVGMAFGFDRLLDALTELGKIPERAENTQKVLVSVFNDATVDYAAQIVRILQKNHIAAELYPDTHKKLEAQIKYALHKKITYFVIAGPEEMQNKMVVLKNLKDTTQKSLAIPELVDILKPAQSSFS